MSSENHEAGGLMFGLEPSQISILVLEDDPDSLATCKDIFTEEGYRPRFTSSSITAKEIFEAGKFHILFIHVAKMPSEGLQFCEWVRRHSTVPIVMLTDRNESVTEAMAIAAGADDYIVRPLTKKMLLVRIGQQLTRSGKVTSQLDEEIHYKNLTLNFATHQFWVGEYDITLTSTEFMIVSLFMKHPERVFTRDQILEAIGIGEGPGTDHIINSHISRIRIKIRNNGGPEVITVIRNMGYKFSNEKKSKNFKLVTGDSSKSFTLIPSHEESDS